MAISVPGGKLIHLAIGVIVFIVIATWAGPTLGKLVTGSIGDIKEETCVVEGFCDEENNLVTLKNCEEEDCNEDEEEKWERHKEEIREIDSSFSIESFASENNIEPEKLKAIHVIESGNKYFDAQNHPVTRFECHHFNKYDVKEKVPCTIKSGETFSRVSSETNKEAFLRAKEIDEKHAIMSSSFGFAQILGSNYGMLGYSTPQEFYQTMFTKEGQELAFLRFIKSNTVLFSELKKEDTDWDIVARQYNGPRYEENDYDTKLRNAYAALKSDSTTT